MDYTHHLTSAQATELFNDTLFLGGRESIISHNYRAQQAAALVRNTRIILLYDDETGCDPHADARDNAEKIKAFIRKNPDISLPPYVSPDKITPQVAEHLFNESPAGFLRSDSTEGIVFLRLPRREATTAKRLSKLCGIEESLIGAGAHFTVGALDNLYTLTQLYMLGMQIFIGKGAAPALPKNNMAYIAIQAAAKFYEQTGGAPFIEKATHATRMVGCFTQGVLPYDIAPFYDRDMLRNNMPLYLFEVFRNGQDNPPTEESEINALVELYNDGARVTAPILAKGLKGTLDEVIQDEAYDSLDDLLTDYAVFCRAYFGRTTCSGADKAHLATIDTDKLNTLAIFHLLAEALEGMKLLTGDKFSSLAPTRDIDALLQRIRFAATPQDGAKPS